MNEIDRRRFLKSSLAIGTAAGLSGYSAAQVREEDRPGPSGGGSAMNLIAPELDTVRVGLIGVGERGIGFVRHFCNIEGARIAAVCDSHQMALDRVAPIMSEYGEPVPALYTGDDYAYRALLDRQDVFGELLHGEAAYIHELRWQMKEIEHKTGSWRTVWHAKRNGNLYPTHGLGPIAQYMGVNRGDRFDYMNSMSSPAIGRAKYARREFPTDHDRNQLAYINGDMNTSLIKTVNGRTIMVQHDTTTPRPYSRHNLIQGANGVFAGFPNRIALENGGGETYHEWDHDMAKWRTEYDHPLWVQMGLRAQELGGHGGMDHLMCCRLIHCLRNGEPLDQNVYDAAAWSVVGPISAESVADRGNSKSIPDFTRGAWQTTGPLPGGGPRRLSKERRILNRTPARPHAEGRRDGQARIKKTNSSPPGWQCRGTP